MKFSALLITAAVAAFGVAASASAAVITMDARLWTPGTTFTTSADYVTEWTNLLAAQPTPPSGYGDQTIVNWNGGQSNGAAFGSHNNIGYHDKVVFTVAPGQVGGWAFRLGIDLGYGGTLLIDGTPAQTRTTDMWWAGSYGNPSQFLAGVANLTAGTHTLDIYGFEGCCDGGTQGQFLSPGAHGFTNFSATPEPTSWAMMIVGLGLSGATLRRRYAKPVAAKS